MAVELALKVDICNRRALERGVPPLLSLLAQADVKAAFFVSFGPDRSGRAIRRLARPGFVTKMWRTRAPRMYGLRTLLYGTLLPAPPVGEAFPELLRAIEAEGHELGLHGFDHVGWHDGLARMDAAAIRGSTRRGRELFESSVGHAPRISGAPGWQVSPQSLEMQDELGLDYASDCRGDAPFYPRVAGRSLATLQVPTTLPTSDEVLGSDGIDLTNLAGHYEGRLAPGVHVLGVHAEAEGLHAAAWLREFLARAGDRGVRIRRLAEIAERARADAPARDVVLREVPGRAGSVAVSCGGETPVAGAGGAGRFAPGPHGVV